MSTPVIGYEDERMTQKTVGTITHNGNQYEIDWRYYEEDGEIIAAEPAAYVFLDDKQLTDFVNPRVCVYGWKSIDELMEDARYFIVTGILAEILDNQPYI